MLQQGQLVVAEWRPPGMNRRGTSRFKRLVDRLLDPRGKRGAQALPVPRQRQPGVAQLHAQGHRATAAFSFLQAGDGGLDAAVDQRPGQEQHFLPCSLDQGVLGADGLHGEITLYYALLPPDSG